MISRRQIISRSAGPIFAMISPNESVLGADDRCARLNSATNATISFKIMVKIGPVVSAENRSIEIALFTSWFDVFRRISPNFLDQLSQSFHHMKALYMPMMEQYFIFPFVKGRCHGNLLKLKNLPISFVSLPFWNRLNITILISKY